MDFDAERLTQSRAKGWINALLRVAGTALACLLLGSIPSQADPNPGNDSDSVTISLSPVVDLGVLVDTTGAAWSDGTLLENPVAMEMGIERLLGTGVKVTVLGTFNKQELQLQGAALDTWTLDTDETSNEDSLRLYGMFTKDGVSSPGSGVFAGTNNLITATVKRAGQTPQANEATDGGHFYEQAGARPGGAKQDEEVDDMAVNTVRRLWLRANMPPTTTSDGQQRFTVTLTAVSGANE